MGSLADLWRKLAYRSEAVFLRLVWRAPSHVVVTPPTGFASSGRSLRGECEAVLSARVLLLLNSGRVLDIPVALAIPAATLIQR